MAGEWTLERIIRLSNAYYNKGLEKAQVRDMSGAILCLHQSLRLYKMNIDARNLLGLIYYEMGEIVDALAEWIISVEYRRKGNPASKYLGMLQHNEEALNEMEMATRKYNQTLVLLQDGSEDLAILQVNKVLNLNPRFVKAYQLAALIYMRRKSYGRAERLLKKAHSIDRTNAVTLRYLDVLKAIAARRRKRKGVEDEDTDPLSADDVIIPTYKETSSGWKTVLSMVVGLGFGLLCFSYLVMPQQTKKLNDDFNQTMIEMNEKINERDGQIMDLERQIGTLQEQISGLEGNLANTNEANANQLQSYLHLMLSVRNFRNNDYYNGVAAFLQVSAEGITDETFLTIYQEIQTEVRTNGPNVLYTAGYDAYQAGNYESAKQSLTLCLQLVPESPDALYWLAMSCKRGGDAETANTYFTQLIDTYPDHALAESARAERGY